MKSKTRTFDTSTSSLANQVNDLANKTYLLNPINLEFDTLKELQILLSHIHLLMPMTQCSIGLTTKKKKKSLQDGKGKKTMLSLEKTKAIY